MSSTRRRSAGQSSVELTALLPLIALLALGAWQALIAGQALWLAAPAARAAARAQALDDDPRAAARAVLPARLAADTTVRRHGDDGEVRVAVAIPSVVGGLRLGAARASARMVPQEGS